jgi:omega-6 fatty acid desaturase (delta-12 desaturase)
MQDQVYRHISKYAESTDIRGSIEFFGTLGLWIGMFWAPWWLFPLHVLVVIRLFVVGVHDTGHMSLFRSRQLNDYSLRITSPIVWMPGLSVWRPGHNYHHSHSNDLDYDQSSQTAPLTVAEFHSMAWWKRALYRYATQPFVVLTQTAPLGMTLGQLFKIATWDEWLLQVAFILLMGYSGVLGRHILITFCSGSFGVFLFHLQHTFVECVRVKGRNLFDNGYYGSSYLVLPTFLKFFTAGIEYHHIHHLSSRVPSYRLQACHEEAPPGMWNGIRTMTLQEGWNSMKLTLWSEAKKRLVSFDEVDKEILLR